MSDDLNEMVFAGAAVTGDLHGHMLTDKTTGDRLPIEHAFDIGAEVWILRDRKAARRRRVAKHIRPRRAARYRFKLHCI